MIKPMTIQNIKDNADHHFKPGDSILDTGCEASVDIWVHELPNGKFAGYTDGGEQPILIKSDTPSTTRMTIVEYNRSDDFTEGVFFGITCILMTEGC